MSQAWRPAVSSEKAFRRDPKTAIRWSARGTLSLIYHAREIEPAKADAQKYRAVLATFSRWLEPGQRMTSRGLTSAWSAVKSASNAVLVIGLSCCLEPSCRER